MKTPNFALTCAALFISLLFPSLSYATLYENAEDSTIQGWRVYDRSPSGAFVSNIYDTEKQSKVIKFSGSGTSNGYAFGARSGSQAWNNTEEHTVQWSMKFSESYSVYIFVQTTNGYRVLYYTPRNRDSGIITSNTQYIHHGLGTVSKNGKWKNITRDLNADLKQFEASNQITAVNGFYVRGSGLIDNIKLIKSPEFTSTTVYDDAENYDTQGWWVYDRAPSKATVSNIWDDDKQSNVLKLDGAGLSNGYGIGHYKGSKVWKNTEQKTLQWSMKYDESYIIYICVQTTNGMRILYYTARESDKGLLISRRGLGYIHHGLGRISKNGTWQTITRDLEADIKEYEGDNQLVSINGFFVRGSGLLDDIKLHKTPSNIPIDSNIELGNEAGILYYADPRIEENGLNRALRIDYRNMTFTDLQVDGINPHSIDRAGETDKFYIRTQNSYSFDVVNFKNQTVKTVDLVDHKPRAIGAYNKKYNIQLISVKDMPIIDVIDVATDTVIKTVGDRHTYDKRLITSNAGNGSATGHAIWLDEDHFVLIDRVHKEIHTYKVSRNTRTGKLSVVRKSCFRGATAHHALEKVANRRTAKDFVTFYALAEGDLTKGIVPSVVELIFNPQTGRLKPTGKTAYLYASNVTVNSIKPTTHHAGISPDGKYFVAPVTDGNVYFIDRATMTIHTTIAADLGAAHIEFSDAQKVAVITNHFNNNVTIIDMNTLQVKTNINIGVLNTDGTLAHPFDPNSKHLLQPHFSYVDPTGRYYYTFSTQDGDFIKIDLKTLEVIERMHTAGAPEQAHS